MMDEFSDAQFRGNFQPSMNGKSFLFPGQAPEAFADFDSIWNDLPKFEEPMMEEEFFQEVNPAIQSTFQDFLHAALEGQPMVPVALHPSDIRFSPEEQLKIRDRSAALARHFCSEPVVEQHIEQQLETLFSALGLGQDAKAVLHQDRFMGS
jgi:hypothetical protein